MNQQFSRPWSWKWNHERKTETFGFLLRESFKRDEACYCLGLWSTMTQILWCGQISAQMVKLFEFLRVCLSLGWSILELDVSFGGWLHQIKSHGTQKKKETPTYGGVWWRAAVTQSGFRKHENAISLPVSQWWRLTGMMNGRDDGEWVTDCYKCYIIKEQ